MEKLNALIPFLSNAMHFIYDRAVWCRIGVALSRKLHLCFFISSKDI